MTTKPGYETVRSQPGLARLGRAAFQCRQAHLAQVALGGEAVHQEAVADLARHLGHELAHGGQQDLGVAVRVRPRVEEGRHQGVRVELAAEGERLAGLPRLPDGPDGQNELPHPGRRVRPRHGEALGDVRLDLAAHAEHEAALAQQLQVVGQDGQRHGVAGERDGDARPELQLLGGGRTDGDGEEGIVVRLGRPHAVVAALLGLDRLRRNAVGVEPDAAVDLHARLLPLPTPDSPDHLTVPRPAGSAPAPRRSRRPTARRRPPWRCPPRRRCSPRACAPWPGARRCRR